MVSLWTGASMRIPSEMASQAISLIRVVSPRVTEARTRLGGGGAVAS